jgi:hypothetical protein
MATKNLVGFGHVNSVDVSSNTTLTLTAHSGVLVNVTASCTITLPATVIGQRFAIRVGAENITVTISPDANDLIVGPGAANSGAGADDKDVIFTSQPAGSYIVLDAITTTGFTISRALGTFTYQS